MAKKKKQQEPEGLWDSISLWIDANQRVFWVVLLTIVSFTFAFPQVFDILGRQGSQEAATIFGDSVTADELRGLQKEVQAVRQIVPEWFYFSQLLAESDTKTTYIYLQEAQARGIVVSDEELGAERRRIWRRLRAGELAVERSAGSANPQEAQRLQYEIFKEYEDNNYFDPADWKKKVGEMRAKMTTRQLEESIRRVLTLRKLEDDVRSWVTVAEDEVFTKYQEDFSKRKGSWVALEPTEGLRAKVRESITEDDVKKHFEANAASYRRGISISADYLRVPGEHFVADLGDKATDSKLRSEYELTKKSYSRPTISPRMGAFELLSSEQMAEKEAELFLTFDEAKDQVKEAWIKKQAKLDCTAAANQIGELLNPESAVASAASFDDLSKSYPYVKVGSVSPVDKDGAEEGFGDVYVSTVINSWYRSASTGDLSTADRTKLANKIRIPAEEEGPESYVYFRNVEVHDPADATLDEVREKVIEELVESKILEVLTKAADEKSAGIDKGEVKLADLAGTEIDVEVAAGVTEKASISAVQATDKFLGRYDSIDVPDSEAEEEDATKPLLSSRVVLGSIFGVSEVAKSSVARDDENDALFLVTFDSVVTPDRKGFDSKKSSLRSQLTREREDQKIQEWRTDLFRRAYGVEVSPEGADAEAGAGAGGAETAAG